MDGSRWAFNFNACGVANKDLLKMSFVSLVLMLETEKMVDG
jgi:hypothetical protein